MTTKIQEFNSLFTPVSGKALRGGKGHVARSHKTIIYVNSQEAADKALAKFSPNKIKVEIFANLEDVGCK